MCLSLADVTPKTNKIETWNFCSSLNKRCAMPNIIKIGTLLGIET